MSWAAECERHGDGPGGQVPPLAGLCRVGTETDGASTLDLENLQDALMCQALPFALGQGCPEVRPEIFVSCLPQVRFTMLSALD